MSAPTANITREQLQELHKRLSETARKVMDGKNADYATIQDPLRNFRWFGEVGIVVRLSDKVARLRTFCERGVLDVKDESVEDTLVDVINYAVLFAAYLQDRKPPAETDELTMEDVLGPVKDGPYCNRCDQLADFTYAFGLNHELKDFICSNCAANAEIDTTNWDLLGRL